MRYEVIPSPGTHDKEWSGLEKRIEIIKPFVKTVHIDIIDNKFAPNLTILDPKPFQQYPELFFEAHFMVDNPIEYISSFAEAGFKRFIGQIEKMPDQQKFIDEARSHGEACLAIDGPTPLENLTVPLETLDGILIMTIQAGFSGQKFMPEHLQKIQTIRNQAKDLPIEVDGGINEETIVLAKNAGANRFVATSAIFNHEDPKAAFEKLTNLVNNTP